MFTKLPAAIVDTILTRLAALFLSGAAGDVAAARQAAAQMLAAYRPETEDEFRLAAQIISFSFHVLEALAQAADPNLPINRVLRLRSGAVSLSRESDKAQRRLDQLQTARRTDISPPAPQVKPIQAEPEVAEPKIEKALNLIQDTRAVADVAKSSGQTWNQTNEERERDRRIAASLQRAEARVAAMAAAQAGTVPTNARA